MQNVYWTYFSQSVEWSEVLGSLIGALLGFISAYWILRIEQHSNERQEAIELRQRYVDIRELITTATSGAIKAGHEYRRMASACRMAPYEGHPWPVHINTALRTLNRMDREAMLKTLRQVDLVSAVKIWKGLLRFIDGFTDQLEHQRQALLAHSIALDAEAKTFEVACHDLHRALATYGTMLQKDLKAEHDTVHRIASIIKGMVGLGDVSLPEMNERLVEPSGLLIRDGKIDHLHGFFVVEAFSKARVAFNHYAKSNMSIARDADRFADAMDEFRDIGSRLVTDMSNQG